MTEWLEDFFKPDFKLDTDRYENDATYRQQVKALIEIGIKHARDKDKPCKGTDINLCVAEACFREACVRKD